MQSIVHLYKDHEHERESQKSFSGDPDFIHNYFLLLKLMFDFFDNRDKCHKPGFLRGNIYTSCISMVLLDHLQTKATLFDTLSPSIALPFPPWVSTSSFPGYQDTPIICRCPVIKSTRTKNYRHTHTAQLITKGIMMPNN